MSSLRIKKDQLGDDTDMLKENTTVEILLYEGSPISMLLADVHGVESRGNRPGCSRRYRFGEAAKPAMVETGATIKVPLYLENGEVIKVDTRTRAYVERVRS